MIAVCKVKNNRETFCQSVCLVFFIVLRSCDAHFFLQKMLVTCASKFLAINARARARASKLSERLSILSVRAEIKTLMCVRTYGH